MEVINIDSSDDEEGIPAGKGAVGVLAAKSRHPGIAATDARSVTQEDGSSVSSADSVWERGLSSKPMKSNANSFKNDVSMDSNIGSDDELEIVGGPPKHQSNDNGNDINIPKATKNANATHTMGGRKEALAPAPTVDSWLGNWKVVLLMDVREFGQHKKTTFLNKVEKQINKHFGDGLPHCEQVSLPSADYMFVARLISNRTGEVIDERVLDLIIERKNVNDLQLCTMTDSKMYRPLSFFEAQMYKLQNCGIKKKLFLMEGDEDNPSQFSSYSMKAGIKSRFVAPQIEQEKRLKRVKTVRLQIENGEWHGVDVVSTKSKEDTVKFLIQQLETLKSSFDPLRPPAMTMEGLKTKINTEMKAPTFQEYLRQRLLPRVGDKKAMKVIMDPDSDWDKSFISPAGTSKVTKSTLEDRATFWGESAAEATARQLANIRAHAMRDKKKSNGIQAGTTKDGDDMCGICRKDVDIFDDTNRACNRVANCGATFHASCLATAGFDVTKADGCIVCRSLGKFLIDGQPESAKADSRATKGEESNAKTAQSSSNATTSKTTSSTKKVGSKKSSQASKRTKVSANAQKDVGHTAVSSKKKQKQSPGKKRPIDATKPPPEKQNKRRKTSLKSATNGEPKKAPTKRKVSKKKSEYVSCGICNMSINTITDFGIVNCNRTSSCGVSYHDACLSAHGYDLQAHDGCIKCESKSKFSAPPANHVRSVEHGHGVGEGGKAAAKDNAGVIMLDSDDEEKKDDDVIVID